jgi:sec-independent protein translocase protein TatB
MFGISMWEVAMIMVVALIALGPKQMVEVARAVGKLYGDLQKMISEARHSIDLDSIMSGTSHSSEPSFKQESPAKPQPLGELMPQSTEAKSGPDFYADLLTSAQNVEPPSAGSAQPTPNTDNRPDDPAQKQDAPPGIDKEVTRTGPN